VQSKIRRRQSIRIYVKYSPAKFHPDPIGNDIALGFLKSRQNKKKKKKEKNNNTTTTTR